MNKLDELLDLYIIKAKEIYLNKNISLEDKKLVLKHLLNAIKNAYKLNEFELDFTINLIKSLKNRGRF